MDSDGERSRSCRGSRQVATVNGGRFGFPYAAGYVGYNYKAFLSPGGGIPKTPVGRVTPVVAMSIPPTPAGQPHTPLQSCTGGTMSTATTTTTKKITVITGMITAGRRPDGKLYLPLLAADVEDDGDNVYVPQTPPELLVKVRAPSPHTPMEITGGVPGPKTPTGPSSVSQMMPMMMNMQPLQHVLPYQPPYQYQVPFQQFPYQPSGPPYQPPYQQYQVPSQPPYQPPYQYQVPFQHPTFH